MMHTIVSECKNVKEVFQGRYALPTYQRPYSWTWDVEKSRGKSIHGPAHMMMDDLLEHYNVSVKGGRDGQIPYILGPMAVWKDRVGGKSMFMVVDGQQRLTTLWLMASAADSLNRGWNEERKPSIDEMLVGKDDDGEFLRIGVESRPETRDVMKHLSLADPDDTLRVGLQGRHLLKVWHKMREWLRGAFQTGEARDSSSAMMNFIRYVREDVLLIVTSLPSEDMAIDYFRCANGRGLPMDEPQHIRSLFYKNLKAHEVKRMDRLWNDITETVQEAMGARSDSGSVTSNTERFLLYYVAACTDKPARSSGGLRAVVKKILSGDSENKDKDKDEVQHLLDTAHDMLDAAKALREIMRGRSPRGNESPATCGFGLLNPNMTIHLIALMSASHLSETLYERFASALSDWSLVVQVSRSHRGYNESLAIECASILRKGRGCDEEAVNKVEELLNKHKSNLAQDFHAVLMSAPKSLSPASSRTRTFILGSMEEKVRTDAGDSNAPSRNKFLVRLKKAGGEDHRRKADYNLDHVMPQSAARKDPELMDCVHSLGNLVILSSSDNSAIQDLPFTDPEKRRAYGRSMILLTQVMVDDEPISGYGRLSIARRNLRDIGVGDYATWTREDINRRTLALADLACQVFGVQFQMLEADESPGTTEPDDLVSLSSVKSTVDDGVTEYGIELNPSDAAWRRVA